MKLYKSREERRGGGEKRKCRARLVAAGFSLRVYLQGELEVSKTLIL